MEGKRNFGEKKETEKGQNQLVSNKKEKESGQNIYHKIISKRATVNKATKTLKRKQGKIL